ncbi:Eukaryotic peptide chain release factor subunit 1 [Venturia nashicola]|nr:Eukaryotic peptide chain release factor subunit 1 [Venturia nashicola]
MTKPIQVSDIIFPALATNFSSTLASLKRSTLSISNRLSSISDDAEFVCRVADAYGLPLIANERCGSWYIPPERKKASAYFKSTDGHNGEWSMSLRRLNTQVIEVINKESGCIIVDSTRRGKSMPDALSKTVPIWCAVWNRVLFPEILGAHALHTPPQCVSPSEHAQIERRLDGFVSKIKELELNLTELRKKITKPMRPMWTTRDSILLEVRPKFEGFHAVVLCTASRRVHGTEVSEGGYIQGAGDDSEGWSQGLTAHIFWKHKDMLMSTNEQDLPDTIAALIDADKTMLSASELILIKPTNWLFAGQIQDVNGSVPETVDGLITCAQTSQMAQLPVVAGKHLHLECRERKLGSRDLRKELSKLVTFMGKFQSPKRLLVCCPTGKDLSIGVILAILCLYADEQGKFTAQATPRIMSKNLIRQRISSIMTSYPSASPSRATLQSVNDFLLTAPPAAVEIPHWMRERQKKPGYILALFESLNGKWDMQRDIVNFRDDGFAGTVTGTARFETRNPTSSDTAAEYLYVENGDFRTTTGMVMHATRRWIWRYHDSAAIEAPISVHFVKADGETENYVYNMLTFPSKEGSEGADGELVLKARAEHPCGEDLYVSTYEFNTAIGKFEVQHEVKGPSKDYISRTTYTKP